MKFRVIELALRFANGNVGFSMNERIKAVEFLQTTRLLVLTISGL